MPHKAAMPRNLLSDTMVDLLDCSVNADCVPKLCHGCKEKDSMRELRLTIGRM